MLADEAKAAIDAMPREALRVEIERKQRSRFKGDAYAYLQTRHAALVEQQQTEQKREETRYKRQELFLKQVSTWVAVASTALTLIVGGGWYQEHRKNQRAQIEANERLINEYLQPIATLHADGQAIYRELRGTPYAEPGSGVLASYLIRIRRDGVPKHSLMKARIDSMIQSYDGITELLKKYAPHALTPAFKKASANYRAQATRLSDRWKSLLEVYASQGNFPVDGVQFPADFAEALRQEIAARKGIVP